MFYVLNFSFATVATFQAAIMGVVREVRAVQIKRELGNMFKEGEMENVTIVDWSH